MSMVLKSNSIICSFTILYFVQVILMTHKENIFGFFNKPIFKHILFWIVVFAYYLSISWPYEKNKSLITQAVLFDLLFQIAIAYTVLKILIPKLLNKNKKILFFIGCFLIIYLAYFSYSAFRCFYLSEVFKEEYAYRSPLIFTERITDAYTFLVSLPSYISPTIVLVVFNYYKQQKETANLLKQKKANELDALKNQLNPHFLFNTLNNLYTLALKKSDKTPEVIAKLSEILDYILYRCKDDFVPLKNEVNLLHNYIALEKVRYGKRVNIEFNENINDHGQIAPLLLLTFLENAFKHGVSQEINTATININITSNSNVIEFNIDNTIPENSKLNANKNRDSIGLQNIKKQLDLLYPNRYLLNIDSSASNYYVTLKLTSNDL